MINSTLHNRVEEAMVHLPHDMVWSIENYLEVEDYAGMVQYCNTMILHPDLGYRVKAELRVVRGLVQYYANEYVPAMVEVYA
jgi:hypothetical protein